jgi:hypothetical protein
VCVDHGRGLTWPGVFLLLALRFCASLITASQASNMFFSYIASTSHTHGLSDGIVSLGCSGYGMSGYPCSSRHRCTSQNKPPIHYCNRCRWQCDSANTAFAVGGASLDQSGGRRRCDCRTADTLRKMRQLVRSIQDIRTTQETHWRSKVTFWQTVGTEGTSANYERDCQLLPSCYLLPAQEPNGLR